MVNPASGQFVSTVQAKRCSRLMGAFAGHRRLKSCCSLELLRRSFLAPIQRCAARGRRAWPRQPAYRMVPFEPEVATDHHRELDSSRSSPEGFLLLAHILCSVSSSTRWIMVCTESLDRVSLEKPNRLAFSVARWAELSLPPHLFATRIERRLELMRRRAAVAEDLDLEQAFAFVSASSPGHSPAPSISRHSARSRPR